MRPTGQRWHLRNQNELNAFIEFAVGRIDTGDPITVQLLKESRSLPQNNLIHRVYGEVARQKDDMSVTDVTRLCKLHYGVPILRAQSEKFRESYDKKIKDNFNYEQKLLIMDLLDVTSLMTTEQATEYLNEIINHWTREGIYIEHAA